MASQTNQLHCANIDLAAYIAVPPWQSPDPSTKLLPLAHRPHASKIPQFLMSVTRDTWSGNVRCYHPEMHAAEISVARELGRLAAAPQLNVSANKVDLWINKNEEQTSKSRLSA